MIRSPRDLQNPNVVVPGLELDEDFDVLGGNAVVLGLALRAGVVGLLGFGGC